MVLSMSTCLTSEIQLRYIFDYSRFWRRQVWYRGQQRKGIRGGTLVWRLKALDPMVLFTWSWSKTWWNMVSPPPTTPLNIYALFCLDSLLNLLFFILCTPPLTFHFKALRLLWKGVYLFFFLPHFWPHPHPSYTTTRFIHVLVFQPDSPRPSLC